MKTAEPACSESMTVSRKISAAAAKKMTRQRKNSDAMAERPTDNLKELTSDVSKFASAKGEELRLRAGVLASDALSTFLTYFLLLLILGIVLGLSAIALLQWLNSILGTPWGTLCVLGAFLLALVVLWVKRNVLFRHLFTGLLTDRDKDQAEAAIAQARDQAASAQKAVENDYGKLRQGLAPARMVLNLFNRSSSWIEIVSAVLGIFRLTRKKRRK